MQQIKYFNEDTIITGICENDSLLSLSVMTISW